MKVLVTGGTGFVGREVCRQLAGKGIQCRCLGRRQPAGNLDGEWAGGSVLDADSLSKAMTGCDAVIHLVGIIAESPGQTYEGIHIGGTSNVVAAAQRAGVDRFLHMSALGTRPAAVSRYHRSKWEAEERVRASGLHWTIFRPSLVYGAGDAFVNLFARIGRWSPVLPVIGDGLGLLQPIGVDEVARCFVRALLPGLSEGRTLDLCGPDRLTLLQVLDEIDAALGRRRLRLNVPRPVAWGQARFLEWLYPAVFRQAPPLNRDQILMLGEDNVGDPEPAEILFGFRARPFGEGIRRFLGPRADRVS